MRRALPGALLALLGVLAVAGTADAGRGPELRRVDVGGHELRVQLSGDTGPTVVLEAAFGDPLETWAPVRPQVARFARVVAYDRAGLGESDEGPLPRDPSRIARELHALLAAVEAEPPYVLVGHSAGGLHVRTFAALYPDEVSALVLVDASHEGFAKALQELAPEAWEEELAQPDAALADAPPAMKAEWAAIKAIILDGTLPGSGDIPDVPTIVLTSRKAAAEPFSQTSEGRALWSALHAGWVQRAKDGIQIVTRDAGHYIHWDDPGLVVRALREACRVVTEGGPLSRENVTGEG